MNQLLAAVAMSSRLSTGLAVRRCATSESSSTCRPNRPKARAARKPQVEPSAQGRPWRAASKNRPLAESTQYRLASTMRCSMAMGRRRAVGAVMLDMRRLRRASLKRT